MSILLQSLPLRAPDCWYSGPVVTLERRGKSEASHTGSVNEEATSNRLATSLPELELDPKVKTIFLLQ